jgi:hypothetical protein
MFNKTAPINSLIFQDKKDLKKKVLFKIRNTFSKLHFPKVDIKKWWLVSSPALFSLVAIVVLLSPIKSKVPYGDHYSVYLSKPPLLDQTIVDISTGDSRAQKIDGVFKKYNCPLFGLGDVFVREADKNNIPWWLAAAISFQESTCGKKVIIVDGVSSYNAWGYAIYGGNVHTFGSFAEGVEQVSKYLGKRFFAQGRTDTLDIMKTYTPPSDGSWAEGVQYFADIIQKYPQ